MSEPEVNESSKDKNIVFDSANIAKNSENKANPFANLADTEAKAKAEEKQKADAEKAQQKAAEDKAKAEEKAHAEEVKKAAKTAEANEKAEEKARKNAKPTDATLQNMIGGNTTTSANKTSEDSKKSGLKSFMWSSWHKFASIICVLIILGATGATVFLILQKNETKSQEITVQEEVDILAKVQGMMADANNPTAFNDSCELYEKEISKSSGDRKVKLAIQYAEFVYDKAKNYQKVIDILYPIETHLENQEQKNDFYRIRSIAYYGLGDEEKYEEDYSKINY